MPVPSTLFVDHTAALGGAELYLHDALCRLPGRHQVLLFEEGPLQERLQEAGVSVTVAEAVTAVQGFTREGGWKQALEAVPGALQLVMEVARRARSHDVVFANSQKAFVVAALAGTIARRPVVWNLHDLLTADHFSRFNTQLVVMLAQLFAARVVVNSEATREAFAAAGGPRPRTRVVYNGLEVAAFADASPAPVRAELGLSDEPLVGVFSRLAPWKGQHVLLEALVDLPEVHALIVGEALFGGEQRYAAALQRQAVQTGIDDRVHFLGFRDDIPGLLRAVDVVVHTSTAPEPFGRVIAEGLLSEKPVVATAAGGAKEIIRDGETGWLVPPGDVQALTRALGAILEDPAEAARRAKAGRADARRRFSAELMVQRLSDVLREVA